MFQTKVTANTGQCQVIPVAPVQLYCPLLLRVLCPIRCSQPVLHSQAPPQLSARQKPGFPGLALYGCSASHSSLGQKCSSCSSTTAVTPAHWPSTGPVALAHHGLVPPLWSHQQPNQSTSRTCSSGSPALLVGTASCTGACWPVLGPLSRQRTAGPARLNCGGTWLQSTGSRRARTLSPTLVHGPSRCDSVNHYCSWNCFDSAVYFAGLDGDREVVKQW